MEYPYQRFRLPLLLEDTAFRSGPYPGEEFPDFDLTTADGDPITREQLLQEGPALITTGSFTSPTTASAGPVLKSLYREFGQVVSFMTLYVRETHPGSDYAQPTTLETKRRHAREYRDRDSIPWTIAVDEISGRLHKQLDQKSNSAYLVASDGTVLFRSLWSNHEWTLREAVAMVAAGGAPMEQREPRLMPLLAGAGEMYRIVDLAGHDAKRDLLYTAPPLYLLARLAHSLPFTGPLTRGVGALGMLFGLGLGAALAALRARSRTAVRAPEED